MSGLIIDLECEGIESAVASGPFDDGLRELANPEDKAERGSFEPISLDVNARLRVQQGRIANVTTNGNYTRHDLEYAKGAMPLFVKDSKLLRPELASQAVKANRAGEYFVALDNYVYEEHLAMAEEDEGKSPFQRRVLILPSRNDFQVSPTVNPETFQGMFGKEGNEYIDFTGLDALTVYLVDSGEVDSHEGTLHTQLWFDRFDSVGRSGLSGGGRYLDVVGNSIRGVRGIELGSETGLSSGKKEVIVSGETGIGCIDDCLRGEPLRGVDVLRIFKGHLLGGGQIYSREFNEVLDRTVFTRRQVLGLQYVLEEAYKTHCNATSGSERAAQYWTARKVLERRLVNFQ